MRRWLKKHHFHRRSDGVWWRKKDTVLLVINPGGVTCASSSRDTTSLFCGDTPWEAARGFFAKFRDAITKVSQVPSVKKTYLSYQDVRDRLREVARSREDVDVRVSFHGSRQHQYLLLFEDLIRVRHNGPLNFLALIHHKAYVTLEVLPLLVDMGLVVELEKDIYPTRQLIALG